MARRRTSPESPDQLSLFTEELPLHPSFEKYAEQYRRSQSINQADKAAKANATASPDPCFGNDDIKLSDNAEQQMRFISFGSGSSGNCAYVGDSHCGILIDAGIEPEHVERTLRDNGIKMSHISGICLTHDHSDHVRFAYKLLRANRHIKLYCTPRVLNGILRRHSISRRIKDYHIAIYKEFPFTIGNFTITAFEVLHDGSDNAGFFIQHKAGALGVATDLGCISERADFYLRQANFLMIESNYDAEMLATGVYPDYLKARIANTHGHLDNAAAASFVASVYSPALRYVFLCHLSNDNNTPDTALEAHRTALQPLGIRIGDGSQIHLTDLQLIALPRHESTPLYILRL